MPGSFSDEKYDVEKKKYLIWKIQNIVASSSTKPYAANYTMESYITYSWGPMFVDCQHFTVWWRHHFVGNWCEALQCIHRYINLCVHQWTPIPHKQQWFHSSPFTILHCIKICKSIIKDLFCYRSNQFWHCIIRNNIWLWCSKRMSESHTFWKHLSKEDVYCAIPAMTPRQYTWWYCPKDCPFKSPSPMKARVLLTFSNCNTHKIVGWLVYFFVYLVYWSIVVSVCLFLSNRICLSVYFFILLSICLSL